STVRIGVRAQVQHLKAYASTAPLNQALVDTRFGYVTRGIAPYVLWLGIQENPNHVGWAAGAGYGASLTSMIWELRGM
ncbi:MAG: N-acetylmuramoyl-L-alanine amidase, partial [Clostridiales Family XIII bacterium]|nr:N-acetylmuramoyl-L-alanine amidase [Clostridiales Family XIII bacterium]